MKKLEGLAAIDAAQRLKLPLYIDGDRTSIAEALDYLKSDGGERIYLWLDVRQIGRLPSQQSHSRLAGRKKRP